MDRTSSSKLGGNARAALAALIAVALATAASAQLPLEERRTLQIEEGPKAHWIFVNDMAFSNMLDSRTYLLDADRGVVLGMISTGMFHNALKIPRDYSELYSVQTYYPRGTRGERTDVVSIYEPTSLSFREEIVIPPKRMTNTPNLGNATLTDDDRFLLVFNMTPAFSATIVDVKARKVTAEVETAGCALLYPTGDRSVVMLCGDGALLSLVIDDQGQLARRERAEGFFDPGNPLQDKPARFGNTWLFYTNDGTVHPATIEAGKPSFGETWSLVDDAGRAESWRPGGPQPLAVHEASGRLFALMHQGGEASHDDPGTEVWIYDLASRKRTGRVVLEQLATAIVVTKDASPILVAGSYLTGSVDVYDASSGAHLRRIEEIGTTPVLLQAP